MAPIPAPLAALLTDAELTRCSVKNHDHRVYPVKGSFHERPGPGQRKPQLSFHCPDCGMVTGAGARTDNWQEHPTIAHAMERGNLFPCALCFPLLSKKFDEILRRR